MRDDRRIRPSLFLALLLCAAAPAVGEEEKPLWLAIGRPAFVDALVPLAEHRRLDGLFVIISTKPVAEALASAPRPPAFLLLVGDDESGREDESWFLPTARRDLYRWRQAQRKTFASDMLFGDLDGDLSPDIPVGRIPARTPGEVQAAVARIIAFETRAPTVDDLRLPVLGGAPGYGPRVDAMATGLLLSNLRRHAPAWVRPWVISAAAGQPLCGWPPDHPALFGEQMVKGGLLTAVLAHAGTRHIHSMSHAGKGINFGVEVAATVFAKGPPSSPLVLLTCLSGDFTRKRRCLAEECFFLPGGPVAVIAATTESHPLTNYHSGVELLRAITPGRRRLGPLWLEIQKKAFAARAPLVEMMLRDAEGNLGSEIDTARLRRDQLLMYAMLGDPATRLKLPKPLDASVTSTDSGWRWTVERPPGATRLAVSLRAPGWPSTAPAKGTLEAETARKRFTEANAKFAFTPLPSPAEGQPWRGEIASTESGTLRLVAIGPRVFRVAVLTLR
jgi:Peptidase family C25